MPPKNPLTDSNKQRLANQLHSTRMEIWESRANLNRYLNQDSSLYRKIDAALTVWETIQSECERELDLPKHEPRRRA